MDVTAITLGQPVLPGRLPFSKPKVNWLLQAKISKNDENSILEVTKTCIMYKCIMYGLRRSKYTSHIIHCAKRIIHYTLPQDLAFEFDDSGFPFGTQHAHHPTLPCLLCPGTFSLMLAVGLLIPYVFACS